ncbi:hypothetical protein LTR15_006616 [Elasticomyces elasticus]|nr:hypothetical protein LTR15_006616 [Elasticomyces elasticus]
MADDLTINQLLRQENDKLLRAQQNLTTVNEGLLSKLHALRTEMHALRMANNAQKTQIDVLRKGRDALMVKIPTLEDRSMSPDALGEDHGVDPSIIRIREILKRKFGYLENGDDTQGQGPDDQQTGTANNDEMTTSDVENFRNTSGAEVIGLGEADVSVVEDAQQQDDSCTLSVRVLAFDEQGKTFILNATDEPAGLRALITTTEVLLKEEFDKHRSGKQNNNYSSWEDCGRRTAMCVRQFCCNDTTESALENAKYAACRRCFNARIPCIRHDKSQPSRGMYVVPLPAAARAKAGRDQLAYYVYQGEGKNAELEKVTGEIWLKRKKRDRKSRSKILQGPSEAADGVAGEEQA